DDLKNLKIDTSLNISDIKELNQGIFKAKEDLILLDFKFTVDYSPKIAKLDFEGRIIFSLESKKAKEILKNWEKKKINDEFRIIAFNLILRKASIRALQLEEEMNLPPHLTLPLIKKKEEPTEK
ncbi:MAG: hypothetical protein KKF67_03360, partial [Nanoarchaeota archaeon]|nr:hypothetical protein [Nanoarchaeota archaeon]